MTNINGLSPDRLREFAAQQSGKPLDEIGELVRVKGVEIADPDFFPEPVEGEEEDEGRSWQPGRYVNPGDLVVIDEAWEWWGAGSKIAPRHHKYFRMHRHGVDAETGIAGDVVLIVQVLSDLHRSVSSVLDFVYSMTKSMIRKSASFIKAIKAARAGRSPPTSDRTSLPRKSCG